MSPSPVLVSAAENARGLLAAMLVSPSLRNFSEDQQALLGEVLDELREALRIQACPTGWSWLTMDHEDLARVKVSAQRVMLFVPKISVTTGTRCQHTQVYPPKLVMAHWATVPATTAAITPGKHALELQQKHGGYWAADKKGVKPVTGAPSLWAYLPIIDPR